MLTSYIQYKWTWMMLCTLLWIVPNAALAQESQLTETEIRCVAKVVRDTIQNNMNRPDIADALRPVRELGCPNDKTNAESLYETNEIKFMETEMKLQSIIHEILPYPALFQTCFPSVKEGRERGISEGVSAVLMGETVLFVRKQKR